MDPGEREAEWGIGGVVARSARGIAWSPLRPIIEFELTVRRKTGQGSVTAQGTDCNSLYDERDTQMGLPVETGPKPPPDRLA
jgi:hypothetical protein